ncbi:MAG: protein kinase, partial [Christensenella sp.]
LLNNTYEIISEIGQGSGGIVYKAHHTRLQNYVVIKQIKSEIVNKLNIRAEADILKTLKHTYLPQVIDFVQENGEIYTVMDFVDGKNFSQELNDGAKFSQKQVIKWAAQLCEALDYLHKQPTPIIHSDIKPANVMLTLRGDVCLIDFNVSQIFSADAVLLGRTDGYAPPEQYLASEIQALRLENQKSAQPELQDSETELSASDNDCTELSAAEYTNNNISDDKTQVSASVARVPVAKATPQPTEQKTLAVNESSDIYSLGATLYCILVGKKPNTSIKGVTPISTLYPNISDGLNYIITKAMQPNPKKRFSSAAEMLKAIKNIHKLDKAYKRNKAKTDIATISLICCFTVSLLLAFFGLQTMQKEKVEKYNSLVEQSVELVQNGKLEQADALAAYAVKLLPQRPGAYYAQAYNLFEQRNYEKAIEYVLETKQKPLLSDTQEERLELGNLNYICGSSYFQIEDYKNACNYYKTALGLNADNSDYYRDFAISLSRIGDNEGAQNALQMAVSNGLENASILLIKGEMAFSGADYNEAVAAFKSAADTSTDAFLKERAYILGAKSYKELGDIQSEISLLKQGVELLPQNNTLLLCEMLGDAYARAALQQPQQAQEYTSLAIACFEALINRGYSRYYIFQNIAILYQNIAQYDNALAMLDKTENAFPNNYRTPMQRAFLLAEIEGTKPNESRSYNTVNYNYNKAKELYNNDANKGQDAQMLMLEDLISEIDASGWLD